MALFSPADEEADEDEREATLADDDLEPPPAEKNDEIDRCFLCG